MCSSFDDRMKIVKSVLHLRQEISQAKSAGRRISLVPTMGHLHEGHLKLVYEAARVSDLVVVSIFVNPTQFGNAADIESYPRTLEEDACQLRRTKVVRLLFAPPVEEMYPTISQAGDENPSQAWVDIPQLGDILEGASRPGHFRGVATVVCKLFNLVQPNFAIFGEKDYQQVQVMRALVTSLMYDIEIISVATCRDANNLALSSRNCNLTEQERCQVAPKLYQIMAKMGHKLSSLGRRRYQDAGEQVALNGILQEGNVELKNAGFLPEQLFIQDAINLKPLNNQSKKAVILMAAILGRVRLIDNLVVNF